MLTSSQNPKIKFLRHLNKRKSRDKYQLFLIEGKREIERALQCHLKPHSYYYSSKNSSLIDIQTEMYSVSPRLFQKISYRKNPTGHIAIFHQPDTDIKKYIPDKNPFLLIIESPEKPGNIGALLRTADAVNVEAVIITDPNTDLFNPNVIRSACGTFFSRPIFLSNNKTTLKLLHQHKINIIATTPDTKQLYHQINYPDSIALIAGTEDEGLSEFWLKNANLKIKIPMTGMADSLNLSVSTGIILYKIWETRQP